PGSDTGGSLRIPAAICGVVGFRPSPGVVPMDARALGWSPLSVLGPMGRSVADTRLLFSAQVGMDDREPLAFPLDARSIALADPVDLGTLRVGWTEDFGQCPVDPETRPFFRRRLSPCAISSAAVKRSSSTSVRPIPSFILFARRTLW